jgi:aminodeoxyfutalosine synthase
MNNAVEVLVEQEKDAELKLIGEKILSNQRLEFDEGVMLFEKASLPYVGALANYIREKLHGDKTYFNRNFHI